MKKITRRKVLSYSLGGTAALGALSRLAVRSSSASPNERLAVAVIGMNGMGHFHVKTLANRPDAHLKTLCDVDPAVLRRATETVKGATGKTPKLEGDFRNVVADPSIDAVVIATPHHWHAPIALRAMKAGKDVYVEKAASHVFREGQLLIEAERKYRRIFQHGTQMRASPLLARAGEILASGILGEIKMSKAWNVQRQIQRPVVPDAPVPEGVDYDLWLGPAPRRPFNPNRFHRNWRLFRDYSNGDIGDDGAHDIDVARWGLGVETHPNRITAHGSRIDLTGAREYPDNMMVAYQYDEGKVLLYEERLWTPYGLHGYDSGNAFYGTEGYMVLSRRGYFQVYLGKKEHKGEGMKEGSLGATARQNMAQFLQRVRDRKRPTAPAQEAHLSCALIHLGEIAYRLARVLHFDPENESFSDNPQANAMLTKEYRAPWGLPDL